MLNRTDHVLSLSKRECIAAHKITMQRFDPLGNPIGETSARRKNREIAGVRAEQAAA